MSRFNFGERIKPKILINIGATMDIPTGSIVTGKMGESIINGGLGQVTAVVGVGNNFKSTLLHYMMLSAADKIAETNETEMLTYDTEINIELSRLQAFGSRFPNLPENLIFDTEAPWKVMDKTTMPANEFSIMLEKTATEIEKDKKMRANFEAFKDPYTKQTLNSVIPSFVEIDSFTEFEAASTMANASKDLDSSDTNTMFMKQGNFKTKFTSILPTLTNKANIFLLMTAHIGEAIDMATGPAKYQQPTKKLQHLKAGDKIKGVGTKFFFLTNNAWMAHTARVLQNKTTKEPEYPAAYKTPAEDLNVVKITQLRSKSGPSGYTLEILVSQLEGVLPSLTEFHYIKQMDRFGLEGTLIHFNSVFLPDTKLTRTTVRPKLDASYKLRRAINITSELLQLKYFKPELISEGLWCEPAELYNDLKEMGYDWDVLLRTRGYWVIDQYNDPVPFLSTVDLLKMRKGLYFPYWMDDKKQVKSKYKLKEDNEK